jgi:hypothetical protein
MNTFPSPQSSIRNPPPQSLPVLPQFGACVLVLVALRCLFLFAFLECDKYLPIGCVEVCGIRKQSADLNPHHSCSFFPWPECNNCGKRLRTRGGWIDRVWASQVLSRLAVVSVNNPDSETGRICQEHTRSNLKKHDLQKENVFVVGFSLRNYGFCSKFYLIYKFNHCFSY